MSVGTTLKLMDSFTAPMQKVFSSLDKMFETLEKVNSSSRNLELDNAMREARNSIGAANEALTQMGQSLEGVNTRSESLFSSFKKYATISALIEGGRRGFNSFLNYDDAVRQVMATKNDPSAELKQTLDRYTSAYATGGLTKKDIAEGFQFTSLAGWGVEESVFAMPTMRDIKRVTGEGFGEMSDLITDSMTPLGLAVNDLPIFADQMAKTQSISNTNMKQMLEAYLGGGFKGVQSGKMSMPELNALLGVFGNAGIKGSEAGTQVRNIMNGLYSTNKKTQRILDKMSITTYDKSGESRNAFDILQEFGTKLNQYDDISQKKIISGMFNVYDEVGLNALMTQLDKLGDYKTQIENSTGALDSMIQIMDGGVGGALRGFLSNFNVWLSGIGSALEPLGILLFSFLQSDFAGTFFTILQVLALGIGGLASVFLLLFTMIDPLTPLIYGLITALGILFLAKNMELLQTKFQTLLTQSWIATKLAEIGVQNLSLKTILMSIPILLKEALINIFKTSTLLGVIVVIGLVIVVLLALAQKFDFIRVAMVKFINALITGVNFLLDAISKIPFIGDKVGNYRISKLDEETALKFTNPFKLPEMPDSNGLALDMPDLNLSDKKLNIGSVDKVGKIDKEVKISDEDIRLMRDVAMKEALIQHNNFKIEQNNSFGDVRETADTNAIMRHLEDMMDEEITISSELVYNL